MKHQRADVVHVTSAHPADDPRIFEKECTTLAAAGYRVHLIATGTAPSRGPVAVSIVPRSRRRLIRMSVGAFGAVIRALQTGATVVHLHDPELAPWIPLLRIFRRTVVFDSHEDLTASVSTKEYLPAPVRAAVVLATRTLVSFIDRTAAAVVTATPAIARLYTNPRTQVVQNFPHLTTFPEKPALESTARLVYIGGLTAGRGARQMVTAVHEVAETYPDVSLTIAGKIPAELLSELHSAPGWDRVSFVGLLDRDGVNELLASTDVGLVLFQPEPNHVESQPTKLFEYMVAGLATVASDFPLWQELVLDGGPVGVTADPTDPSSIAHAIRQLLDDPTTIRQMGSRAVDLVRREHNWEVEGKHLVELYERLGAPRHAVAARP